MSSYIVKVLWKKNSEEAFIDKKYSRVHIWSFDGGIELNASSSPHIVPLPYSNENAVDPEEAFVASISSCHMLMFLSLAAGKKYIVDKYEDNAEGILAKNEEGKLSMTEVILKPIVKFSGDNIPLKEQVGELHHLAHKSCFIASSVKTKINIFPHNELNKR